MTVAKRRRGTMSYLGYVIEQLINEDEKGRIARKHRRKRRLAGAVARSQSPESGDDAKRVTPRVRRSWALLMHRP
jgi:hypothetical protein